MCGICGIISGTLSGHEVDIFKDLLKISQLRGEDSTGIISIDTPITINDKKKSRRVIPFAYDKDIYDSSFFLSQADQRRSNMMTFGKRALIGHCRAATVGKISIQNAHPFDFPNVIGVHNGTMRYAADLDFLEDFETDSEAVYANIDKYGIDETVDRIGKMGGAYALVYYDKKNAKLCFIRNDERPLWFAYNSGLNTLMWASIPEMLWLVGRNRSVAFGKKNDATFHTIKPYHLWSIGLDPEYTVFSHDNITSREIIIKPKIYKTQNNFGGRWDPETNTYVYPDEKKETKKLPAPVIKGSEDAPFVKEVQKNLGRRKTNLELAWERAGSHKETSKGFTKSLEDGSTEMAGYGGEPIRKDKLNQLFMNGCAICQRQPDIEEKDIEFKIGWAERGLIICPECIKASPEFVGEFSVRHQNRKPSRVG